MAPKKLNTKVMDSKKQSKPRPKSETSSSKSARKATNNNGPTMSDKQVAKMIQDPCNADLTLSPFGASEDAYVWRMNYRQTVTSNATGFLAAALYPLGVYNTGAIFTAPQPIQVWSSAALDDATVNLSASSVNAMPGLAALCLGGMVGQIRVTAGCIKLHYTGAANNAAGEMYGWEGQGDAQFAYNSANALKSKVGFGTYALTGQVFPITAGVEAGLNYSQCPSTQTNYGDPAVTHTDVYSPMAVVGVSGGAPSAPYILEATIIVEWVPVTNVGIPKANVTLVAPGTAERVANLLKIASPMLVRAGEYALGGYASAVADAYRFGKKVYRAL